MTTDTSLKPRAERRPWMHETMGLISMFENTLAGRHADLPSMTF
jgi:hypothetical protein